MQGARDQLLAGAGFAQDADAGFAGRHTVHLRHDELHALARVHDLVLADALAQVAILVLQRFSLRTLSTVSSNLSVESGFSRKSSAPRRVARTAISIFACR